MSLQRICGKSGTGSLIRSLSQRPRLKTRWTRRGPRVPAAVRKAPNGSSHVHLRDAYIVAGGLRLPRSRCPDCQGTEHSLHMRDSKQHSLIGLRLTRLASAAWDTLASRCCSCWRRRECLGSRGGSCRRRQCRCTPAATGHSRGDDRRSQQLHAATRPAIRDPASCPALTPAR